MPGGTLKLIKVYVCYSHYYVSNNPSATTCVCHFFKFHFAAVRLGNFVR